MPPRSSPASRSVTCGRKSTWSVHPRRFRAGVQLRSGRPRSRIVRSPVVRRSPCARLAIRSCCRRRRHRRSRAGLRRHDHPETHLAALARDVAVIHGRGMSPPLPLPPSRAAWRRRGRRRARRWLDGGAQRVRACGARRTMTPASATALSGPALASAASPSVGVCGWLSRRASRAAAVPSRRRPSADRCTPGAKPCNRPQCSSLRAAAARQLADQLHGAGE